MTRNPISSFKYVCCLAIVALPMSMRVSVAQTNTDWQQLARLQTECQRFIGSGKGAQAAEVGEQIAALVKRRFPEQLQFLGFPFLAEARIAQGRYKDGLELHMKALDLIPRPPSRDQTERRHAIVTGAISLHGVGACHSKLGQYEQAVVYLTDTVKFCRSNGIDALGVQSQHDLAFVYRNMGALEKAIAQFRTATAVLETKARQERTPGFMTVMLGHTLSGWGSVYKLQGRFDLAAPKIRRGLKIAVSVNGWRHPRTAEIATDLGNIYDSQGRWAEAEPYYRVALETFVRTLGEDHPDTTRPRTNLARILRNQNRLVEAEREFRQIASILESKFGPNDPEMVNAWVNLAITLNSQGKHEEAARLIQRSRKIQETSESLSTLAAIRFEQGEPSDALKLLDLALAKHLVSPESPAWTSRVYDLRGQVLWDLDRRDEAIDSIQKSIEQVEIQRGYSSGTERERASLFYDVSHPFDQMIAFQADLGDVSKLFAAIEQRKARSFLDELRLKNIDLLAGLSDSQRESLNEKSTELRRELSQAEQAYHALPTTATQQKHKEAADAIFDARAALYRHLTEVRSSSPAYRKLITSQSEMASLRQLQKRMADDEVTLAYHIDDSNCFVVIIKSASASFERIVVSESPANVLGIQTGMLTNERLSKTMFDKSTGVLPALSSSDGKIDVNDKLAALWKVLVPENVRSELTNGEIKLLTVLPSGPLALLPFEALIVSNGTDPNYLLDVGPPILYAPSATVLQNLSERKQPSEYAKEPVLTIGDPEYSQSSAGPDAIDRRLGTRRPSDRFRAGLTRLPGSGTEASWVQTNFKKNGRDAVRLTRGQATEASFRRMVVGREIIHLACHGIVDHGYGNFFGALALTPGRRGDPNDDGFLSMSEICELNLDGCELAILSACETNYGPRQQGEGVWALSRGFLVAGARRVIASNWVVDDRSAPTLMSYFCSYLARKDSSSRDFATALHNAKKLIRKDERWKNPFYWSSLVLVGPN